MASRAAALLAVLGLAACAAPAPRPWMERDTARSAPESPARLPDVPDAFRAELSGHSAFGCSLRGNAVYLGEGRFLTAAHLVDGIMSRLRNCAGAPMQTTIHYAGRDLPVRLLRMGEGYVEPGVGPLYRRGEDLALLQAPVTFSGPAALPCGDGPAPGQPVLVLSTERRQAVRAGAMMPESRAADGTYADIPMSLAQGESGSGVFDAESHCLLGIVSHRPNATPTHSRIVPAAAIRAFLRG
ncbi:MAG TPA: serine protease [Roseomonas sp.]